MTDTWTDRLSEYLDDELTLEEQVAIEAHLRACRECSATLEELRQVASRAAALPSRPPAGDLWPGIERRMFRRVSFTLPQLAAAGIALMVMSGGGVWVLVHGGRATSMPPVAATSMAVPASLADPRYDEAIADLEQALNAGRGDLDPATIKVLEANLAAIDKAIEQSQQALTADPANLYLNTHLADARQRKLALLRRAAALAGGKS
jgi:tetratricopeptide (TPR) repeat protein